MNRTKKAFTTTIIFFLTLSILAAIPIIMPIASAAARTITLTPSQGDFQAVL